MAQDELHPEVAKILYGGKYIFRGRSEAFTEHEIKNKKGEVVRKVTKDDLERFARTGNEKAKAGALSPLGAGHTFDDIYDANGQLVKKFPEEDQPQPIGYLHRYSVEFNPATGKHSLYVDEYVERRITLKDGTVVDGRQYAATFPRRSAEVYHSEGWLDWLAILRRAPRLDLALNAYAMNDPDHAFYAHLPNCDNATVCEMARGKMRYSMDTGGAMEADQSAKCSRTIWACSTAIPGSNAWRPNQWAGRKPRAHGSRRCLFHAHKRNAPNAVQETYGASSPEIRRRMWYAWGNE